MERRLLRWTNFYLPLSQWQSLTWCLMQCQNTDATTRWWSDQIELFHMSRGNKCSSYTTEKLYAILCRNTSHKAAVNICSKQIWLQSAAVFAVKELNQWWNYWFKYQLKKCCLCFHSGAKWGTINLSNKYNNRKFARHLQCHVCLFPCFPVFFVG